MKIAIAGIGGVGGYFGGLLAKKYESGEHDIFFIARGEHAISIRVNGLQMKTADGDFTVHPAAVTADPSGIGTVDLVLFCTKSYDLDSVANACSPMVTKDTVLLPLLNGVDATERLL